MKMKFKPFYESEVLLYHATSSLECVMNDLCSYCTIFCLWRGLEQPNDEPLGFAVPKGDREKRKVHNSF
jgi:hypothetical protein